MRKVFLIAHLLSLLCVSNAGAAECKVPSEPTCVTIGDKFYTKQEFTICRLKMEIFALESEKYIYCIQDLVGKSIDLDYFKEKSRLIANSYGEYVKKFNIKAINSNGLNE